MIKHIVLLKKISLEHEVLKKILQIFKKNNYIEFYLH